MDKLKTKSLTKAEITICNSKLKDAKMSRIKQEYCIDALEVCLLALEIMPKEEMQLLTEKLSITDIRNAKSTARDILSEYRTSFCYSFYNLFPFHK